MLGHHVGNFVALENVLKCLDRDAEVFARAHEREDFILPVRMAMNVS